MRLTPISFAAVSVLVSCASGKHEASGGPPSEPAALVETGPLWDRFPMEECSGEIDHDTWTLTCPEFVASRTVIEWDDTWTQSLILNTTLATLREGAETVGATTNRHPAPGLSVDGGHGYAMKIETGGPGNVQKFAMTTYARPIDDQRVVGVICMDLERVTSDRCEQISVGFARDLPQIDWLDLSRPTQFAGRLLNAPPSCETDGESTITCNSGAELIWFERADADLPTGHLDELEVVRRAIIRVNAERTGLEPTPSEQGFDCRLDGEVGECKIFRYEYGANALYIVTGATRVREVDVAILCDWTSDLTDEIPIPCSLVVDPTLSDTLTKEL